MANPGNIDPASLIFAVNFCQSRNMVRTVQRWYLVGLVQGRYESSRDEQSIHGTNSPGTLGPGT